MNKASKTTSKCHHCRVRAPPVELDEYKQSKTLPLTVGFRALLHSNTLHLLVEPVPRHTMYHSIRRSSTAVSARPPPPSRISFPLLLFMSSTVAWIGQLVSTSVLCHFVMKRPAASTTPRYQFPPFLAALDLSALFTPKIKGRLSGDSPVALNALISSARYLAQLFSGRPGPGLSPHQPSSLTSSRDGSAAQLPFFIRLMQRGGGGCGWSSQCFHIVLRVLAVGRWWSLRRPRSKPISVRRRFYCAVRRSAKCPWPRFLAIRPYSRASITSVFSRRTFRVNPASSMSYVLQLTL